MPRDDATDPHDHVACTRAWQTLRRAHDRVARRLTTDLAQECGLAINDVDVLLHLRTSVDTPVRVTDLRAAVPLSQPALSRLVARLAERGLIVRSGSADDARAATLTLTDDGQRLLARAAEVHALAVHEELTSKVSDDEQATLLATLALIDR